MSDIVLGLLTALAVSWLLFAVVLVVARPPGGSIRDLVRFLPNIIRLLRGLYRDPAVGRSVRWRLWIALAYNVQPFTIIPDFVPVIGFADNVVITAWALRSAVRQAGPEVVIRHWPGSREELELLYRLARLGPPPHNGAG